MSIMTPVALVGRGRESLYSPAKHRQFGPGIPHAAMTSASEKMYRCIEGRINAVRSRNRASAAAMSLVTPVALVGYSPARNRQFGPEISRATMTSASDMMYRCIEEGNQ